MMFLSIFIALWGLTTTLMANPSAKIDEAIMGLGDSTLVPSNTPGLLIGPNRPYFPPRADHYKSYDDVEQVTSMSQRMPVYKKRRAGKSGHRRGRRSTSYHNLIFTERWANDNWAHSLGNPCRAEPTPADWANDTVLDIDGRLDDVRRIVRSISRSIDDMTKFMRLPECSTRFLATLPPLPMSIATVNVTGFTHSMLDELYDRFYLLSAHFKVMHRDWVGGRTCNAEPEATFPTILEVAGGFRRAQCLMMKATDPHPFAAPYPTARLWIRHGRRMEEEYYHYLDCSARGIRDSVLVNYARNLLAMVEVRALNGMLAERMQTN